MPVATIYPMGAIPLTATNPRAGTSTGANTYISLPFRGRVLEAGFSPNSLVASAMTMAVAINDASLSSAASNFVQIISSTLGTFSSANLFEGAVASVIPPSPARFNSGDTLQFTTSGGNSSAIGAGFYAIVVKGN